MKGERVDPHFSGRSIMSSLKRENEKYFHCRNYLLVITFLFSAFTAKSSNLFITITIEYALALSETRFIAQSLYSDSFLIDVAIRPTSESLSDWLIYINNISSYLIDNSLAPGAEVDCYVSTARQLISRFSVVLWSYCYELWINQVHHFDSKLATTSRSQVNGVSRTVSQWQW